MNEPTPGAPLRRYPIRLVQHEVEQGVADIASGAERDFCGNAGFQEGLEHRLDRQGDEPGRRAVRDDALVDGLMPCVVRDAGVGQVEGHALKGQPGSAA